VAPEFGAVRQVKQNRNFGYSVIFRGISGRECFHGASGASPASALANVVLDTLRSPVSAETSGLKIRSMRTAKAANSESVVRGNRGRRSRQNFRILATMRACSAAISAVAHISRNSDARCAASSTGRSSHFWNFGDFQIPYRCAPVHPGKNMA
jgi:hypothetical protein